MDAFDPAPPVPPSSKPRQSRRTANLRTGGRSERVVRDVLRAAMDELSKSGYGPMRVDEVAARAGVNKTTVYRRWPTKADLVAAAVKRLAGYDDALVDTGSLRGDLIGMLNQVREMSKLPEVHAVSRIVTDARQNPDLEPIARVLRNNATEGRKAIVERAKARGEIAQDLDGSLLLDALTMPVSFRIMRYGEDISAREIEALVDMFLHGVLQKRASAAAE